MYQEYLNQLQVSIAPLSSEELKELLNNDEIMEEKIDKVLEDLKAHKNSLCEVNRTQAEQNIEKEPKILEMRSKLNELLEEGRQCCGTVQEKLAAVKEKSGSVSQETALALLQTAAAESEEKTEDIFKQFTDNELSVEAFLEEFLAARKTMHLRKLKAEKMQELVRQQAAQAQQQQRGGSSGPDYSNLMGGGGGGSGFFPKPPYPTGGLGGGVPYPMNPMMPMPPPRPGRPM